MSRSPFWPLALAGAGALAAATRWWLQGSGNVYTDAGKVFYVPDAELGWRRIEDGPLWLGLDGVGVLACATLAVAVGAWWVRRRERRGRGHWAWRVALWSAAALPLVIPAYAFATGLAPDDARERLPAGLARPPTGGVEASLPGMPAGSYEVVAHEGSFVAATLKAGGETFEARFGGVRGAFVGDPSDLEQPMRAELSLEAASIDTGIGLRSEHAREDLRVEEHPRVVFRLVELRAARQEGEREVAFTARGEVELIGRTHPVEVTGTLRALGAGGRERLGLGDAPSLVVRAGFSLQIDETAIGNDGTFDSNEVPLAVSLVMVHRTKEET